MKVSKYNILTEINGDAPVYVYNTLTNDIKKICGHCVKEHYAILSDAGRQVIDDEFIDAYRGFLVENSEDEDVIISRQINSEFGKEKELYLTIVPTNECNFRCVYCYQRDESPKSMSDVTQQEIIRHVSQVIDQYSGLMIGWFGGEPTLCDKIVTRLSKAFSAICLLKHKYYMAGMTTNGYLLNLDCVKRWYRLGIKSYQITIDGPEQIHNQQRIRKNGEGTFRQIVQNLISIRDGFAEKDFGILIRTNITALLEEHFEQYVDLLYHLFGNDSRFHFHFTKAYDWGGERIDSFRDNLLHSSNLSSYIKIAFNKGLNIDKNLNNIKALGSVCYAARKGQYVINYDGILSKCTLGIYDEANHIGKLSSKGNVFFDQRKVDLFTQVHLEEKCKECRYLPLCMGCACPYKNYRDNKTVCPNLFDILKDLLPILYERNLAYDLQKK